MTQGTPCCLQCPYKENDACVIYGTPVRSTLVCALFRKWHHRAGDDVLHSYPILGELEPGVVYHIDNDLDAEPNPRPAYCISKIAEGG